MATLKVERDIDDPDYIDQDAVELRIEHTSTSQQDDVKHDQATGGATGTTVTSPNASNADTPGPGTQEDVSSSHLKTELKEDSEDTTRNEEDIIDAGPSDAPDNLAEDFETSSLSFKPTDYLDQISKSIGPGGGILELADGIAWLEIPSGALDKKTNITLSTVSSETDHPPLGDKFIIGPIVQLEPDGLQFLRPVTLSVKHVAVDLALRDLEVWTMTTGRNPQWELYYGAQTGSNQNTHLTKDVVQIRCEHFSPWWFLGRKVQLQILPFITADLQSSRQIGLTVYALKSCDVKTFQPRMKTTKYVPCLAHDPTIKVVYDVHKHQKRIKIHLKDVKCKSKTTDNTDVWAIGETPKYITRRNINRGLGNARCWFDLTSNDENVDSIMATLKVERDIDDPDYIDQDAVELRIEHTSTSQQDDVKHDQATGGATGTTVTSPNASNADTPGPANPDQVSKKLLKKKFAEGKVLHIDWKWDDRKISQVPVSATSTAENENPTKSEQTVEVAMSFAAEHRSTCKFMWKDAIGVNAKAEVTTEIPFLVKGGLSLGLKNTYTFGKENVSAEFGKEEVSSKVIVKSETGTTTYADTTMIKHIIMIPFIAILDDGRKPEGEFEGVQYITKTTFTDQPVSKP
ncbi:uncharacterized protein [Amphiura filiformis]|uniref:uncharacterized protein n=1 Tax=Amphiura filiformis TaxID=82378 RepID=UPI003B2162BC